MVKLINTRGGETWVHESRLDEYLARGFQFAAPPMPPAKPAASSGQNPTTAKKTTKKTR